MRLMKEKVGKLKKRKVFKEYCVVPGIFEIPGEKGIKISCISRELRFREIKDHRFIDCSYYQTCLNFANEEKFHSFSCSNCPKINAGKEIKNPAPKF